MAVPAVLVEVLMGTRDVESVLAANTLVDVLPVTVAVTTFWLYCAGTLMLQSGKLQVAVMEAVPGATAVMVAGLFPVVPLATVAVALTDELQVRLGRIYWPALSYTSAVRGCVPTCTTAQANISDPISPGVRRSTR